MFAKVQIPGLALLVIFAVGSLSAQPPDTAKRIVADSFFGKEISDPYRWLENIKDPEVLGWLKNQNDYTRFILDNIPERTRILNRIRELDAQEPPPLSNFALDDRGRYYFYRSGPNGLAKGYVRDPTTGKERLLIDPEKLALHGQIPPKINGISPSPDGKYVAFRFRDADRTKVYIMEVETGKLVGKPVENVLGFTGLDWDPDSKSIYLVKLPPPRPDMPASDAFLNGSSYRHKVGSDPISDQQIIAQGQNRGLELKPTSWPFVYPTPDAKYLAVWIEDGSRTGHALYVALRKDILEGKGQWREIANFSEDVTQTVFHRNDVFMISSGGSDGRPKLYRSSERKGELKNADPINLPDNAQITEIQAASDALYVAVNEGATGALYRIAYDGKIAKLSPPIDGSIESVAVSPNLPGGLYKVVGWTRPAAIYRIDTKGRWVETNLQPISDLAKNLDLHVELIKVPSHDGVPIALTIIYRRGLKRDGSNPTYMIGYGSYAATLDPLFDNVYVPWFESGGVLAFAHVRGGGELGETWHRAGSKENKPNTWLDFIACAKYLIDNGYTSPQHLAGGGTSAGGILIGRAITERPDLFGAALISVGTTDMLRAEYQMNGPANIAEFGTVKEKTGFDQLYEMSAYHHVKDGIHYPAVLLSTGMKDTNVDVWQPAKMAALLQAVSKGDRPVLLRVDPEAGHDQWGSTRGQIQELRADQITFLLWQLGFVKPQANVK